MLREKILNLKQAADYLHHRFIYQDGEHLHILYLRQDGGVIDSLMQRGAADHIELNLRAVFWRALENDAANLLIAHNHPNGRAEPSSNDRQMTQVLASVGRSLDIGLLDHLIYAGGDWFSFRQAGLL